MRHAAPIALALAAACAARAGATQYPGFMPTVTDSSAVFTIPLAPRPPYFTPTVEPTFHTKVTRIAGDSGTAIGGGVSGTWAADVRHHYSKDQPWSSDGKLLEIDNGGAFLVLDGETYVPKFGRCSNYSRSDDRWHPSPAHPRERINVNHTELMWFDVVNCVKTRSWTLPFEVTYFGPSEGNSSRDGRFAALTNGTQMFVVDMDPQPPFAPYPNSRIGPPVRIDDCGLAGGCTVDWVSVSASGRYVVVSYDGDHPRVYDVNPTTLALTPRPMPDAAPRCSGGAAAQGFIYDLGHADLTLNPFDGNEDVLVGQEHCGNWGRIVNGVLMGSVAMVRLKDGAVFSLTDPANEAYPHHISARNYDRPGWVYVGYRTDRPGKYIDEIIAVKMDGSHSVQRFAHKHTDFTGCYRCESHAVPSPDGRRVLWASTWTQNCSTCGPPGDIKPYIVDARAPADTTAPAAITDLQVAH